MEDVSRVREAKLRIRPSLDRATVRESFLTASFQRWGMGTSVSFQREFSPQRETPGKNFRREKNLPSTETTGQPCSLFLSFFLPFSFLFFFFSMPPLFDLALHKPWLLKFYSPFNYPPPPLLLLRYNLSRYFSISLSLDSIYIYIYILIRQPNGAIFESGVSPDPTSGSNIVRMKFSQTLLVYKNPIRTRHKRKRREGI